MKKYEVYMDCAGTSKPSDKACEAVMRVMKEIWGNPSSTHLLGHTAAELLEQSRKTVLSAVFPGISKNGRLLFTSGGTEANNLALKSFALKSTSSRGIKGKGKIIITDGEHSSVEQTAAELESIGIEVVRIPTRDGILDLDFLEKYADENVSCAAVMLVNNETGALYDVKSAVSVIRRKSPGALIHCDGVQAFMKMPLSPAELGVDSLSVSSHKIHGPKGTGALWASEELFFRKRFLPLASGGDQEWGVRPGTENLPGIAGFAAAAGDFSPDAHDKVRSIRNTLENRLLQIPDIRLNIPASHADGIISVTLPGIKSEVMLNFLSGKGVCVSAGSACHAKRGSISKTLLAYGLSKQQADCTIRMSFDDYNSIGDAQAAADAVAEGVSALARMKMR